MPPIEKTESDIKYDEFIRELAAVINKYSLENRSDTPDYMLAEYMAGCLTVYENTISNRTEWFKRD